MAKQSTKDTRRVVGTLEFSPASGYSIRSWNGDVYDVRPEDEKSAERALKPAYQGDMWPEVVNGVRMRDVWFLPYQEEVTRKLNVFGLSIPLPLTDTVPYGTDIERFFYMMHPREMVLLQRAR